MVLLTFAQRLEQARIAAGLSKYALAQQSGLHLTHVQKLCKGDRPNPRMETVQKLAKVLGVRMAWLLGEEECR